MKQSFGISLLFSALFGTLCIFSPTSSFACDSDATNCGGSSNSSAGAISRSNAISGSNSGASASANPVAINAPTTNINTSTGPSSAELNFGQQQNFAPSATVIFAPEGSKIPPSAPNGITAPLLAPSIFTNPPQPPAMANMKAMEAYIEACTPRFYGPPRISTVESEHSTARISFLPGFPARAERESGMPVVSVRSPRVLSQVSCAGLITIDGQGAAANPVMLMTDAIRITQERFPGSYRYILVSFESVTGYTVEAKSGGFGLTASPGGSFVPEGAKKFLQMVAGVSGSSGTTAQNFVPSMTYFVFVEDQQGRTFDFSPMMGDIASAEEALDTNTKKKNGNGKSLRRKQAASEVIR